MSNRESLERRAMVDLDVIVCKHSQATLATLILSHLSAE